MNLCYQAQPCPSSMDLLILPFPFITSSFTSGYITCICHTINLCIIQCIASNALILRDPAQEGGRFYRNLEMLSQRNLVLAKVTCLIQCQHSQEMDQRYNELI